MPFDRIVYLHTLQMENLKKEQENQINIISNAIGKSFSK